MKYFHTAQLQEVLLAYSSPLNHPEDIKVNSISSVVEIKLKVFVPRNVKPILLHYIFLCSCRYENI